MGSDFDRVRIALLEQGFKVKIHSKGYVLVYDGVLAAVLWDQNDDIAVRHMIVQMRQRFGFIWPPPKGG